MQYSKEDLTSAKGDPRPRIDPSTAYLLGPTSEYDDVYLFDHKLDALLFVRSFFEHQLTRSDMTAIDRQVKTIRKSASDEDTPAIGELLMDNSSMEIYSEGYWGDFVISSLPYWGQWSEYLDGDDYSADVWDAPEQEVDELDEVTPSSGAPDPPVSNFIFSEPPDDPFHPEFLNAMVKIIPVA